MTWLFFALGSSLSAALVTIFAKAGVRTLNPTIATTVRTIIMALLLILVSVAIGKFDAGSLSQLSKKEWIFLIFSGIAGAVSLLFYFWALKTGPAGKVAVIDRTSLVFIIVFSAIFFAEKLNLRSIIGILFVVLGAIAVSWK